VSQGEGGRIDTAKDYSAMLVILISPLITSRSGLTKAGLVGTNMTMFNQGRKNQQMEQHKLANQDKTQDLRETLTHFEATASAGRVFSFFRFASFKDL